MGSKKITQLLQPAPETAFMVAAGGHGFGGKNSILIESFVTKEELLMAVSQTTETIDDMKRQSIHSYAKYQADQLERDGQISQLNACISNLTLDINELEKAMIAKEEKFNKKLRTQESWTIVFGLLMIVLFIWTIVLTLK